MIMRNELTSNLPPGDEQPGTLDSSFLLAGVKGDSASDIFNSYFLSFTDKIIRTRTKDVVC